MKLKKMLSLLVSAALSISLVQIPVLADTADTWDGSSDTSWYDDTNPQESYEITTAKQLAGLAELVNGGTDFDGVTFTLTTNIDLAEINWTPIGLTGSHANEYSFRGYFDGNDMTISNLSIEDTTDTADILGLFGHIHGKGMNNTVTPSVKDLTLKNVNITSTDSKSRIGGLAGNPYTCYIENVDVYGIISGGKWTGGLAGNCYTYFEDCLFDGEVTSKNQAGGIAGAGDARCYNCKSFGDISATYWAGGIIGNGQEGASAVGCYAEGNVSASSNWYRGVGGIAGVAGHGYTASIFENNYFNGEVFLEGEKIDVPVIGIVNVSTNEDINTQVTGNSWNTEYYPADLAVPVVGEVEADATAEEYLLGAKETLPRNNNLIMLESDLQYVDTFDIDDVIIMSGSTVTTEEVKETIVSNSEAVIGETPYETLADAFAAANADDTITLLADAEISSYIQLDKNITIDLGGNTLNMTAEPNTDGFYPELRKCSYYIKANVTFANGAMVVSNTEYAQHGNFFVEVNKSLTFNDVDLTTDGINAFALIQTYGDLEFVNETGVSVSNENSTFVYSEENLGDVNVDNSAITLENVKGGITGSGICFNAAESEITMTNVTGTGLANVDGTVTNTNISITGAEKGIKNTIGNLVVAGNSNVTVTGSTVSDIQLGATATLDVADTATVNVENANYVKLNGKYYGTIKSAIDAASEGDVIDLCGATIDLPEVNSLKITKSVEIKNGTIDITDGVWNGNSIIEVYGGTEGNPVVLTMTDLDVIGDNYSSAFGVIYAYNHGKVVLNNCDFTLSNEQYSAGGVLKGNGVSVSAFDVTGGVFNLENPNRIIANATVNLNGVDINAKVTDETLVPGTMNNHAFRNVVGTITDSNIIADGFETGIKNDVGVDLNIDGTSSVTLKNSVDKDLILSNNGDIPTKVIVADTALLYAENVQIDNGSVDGDVVDEYTTAPVITPNAQAFRGKSDTITITCEEEGAKIYYTTDGTNPTLASTLYTGGFNVRETCEVKAIALVDGKMTSEVTTASFVKKTTSSSSGSTGSSTPSIVYYTVKFVTNSDSTINDVKVKANSTLGTLQTPEKEGYIFEGWYTDAELTNAYNTEAKVTKDFTLYAKWTEEKAEDKTEEGKTEENDPNENTPVEGTEMTFTDVSEDFWGYEGIKHCYENGIMNGMTDSTFEPNRNASRAMLITMLYRLEGEPEVSTEGTDWYSKAQAWAMEANISDGTNMEANITREQLVTMLYRYASKEAGISATADLSVFSDGTEISEYATEAMMWAVENGIITGMGNGTIAPKQNATRAQIATIFARAADIL